MNPVIIVHLLAAIVAVTASVPLIQKRVKMNHWYGVRIPASFASEEAWFDINRYGGRLLLAWGLAIAATAIGGAFLERKDWVAYNWTSLVIILGGLTLVLVKILAYARKRG
jgi:uncharacterized membrane protein